MEVDDKELGRREAFDNVIVLYSLALSPSSRRTEGRPDFFDVWRHDSELFSRMTVV